MTLLTMGTFEALRAYKKAMMLGVATVALSVMNATYYQHYLAWGFAALCVAVFVAGVVSVVISSISLAASMICDRIEMFSKQMLEFSADGKLVIRPGRRGPPLRFGKPAPLSSCEIAGKPTPLELLETALDALENKQMLTDEYTQELRLAKLHLDAADASVRDRRELRQEVLGNELLRLAKARERFSTLCM